ncbi:hypothetical protein D3C80_1000090 [compost metagenome]
MRTVETEGILDYKVAWYETGDILDTKGRHNYRTLVDGVDHLYEPWSGVGVVQNGELIIIESALKLPVEPDENISTHLPAIQGL